MLDCACSEPTSNAISRVSTNRATQRLSSFLVKDTWASEIYTLSLHDALPISEPYVSPGGVREDRMWSLYSKVERSEEHTSELQSRQYLVCRLLLEKKKREIAAGRTWFDRHSRAFVRRRASDWDDVANRAQRFQ